jgi:hypothetical protein
MGDAGGNRATASWLERIMLGQLALKLAREHICEERVPNQVDAKMLFTSEMRLNYQSPLVGRIWQRCRDALTADA